ncbi:MAG: UbiA family prenyltransferase [Cryomorphaceae bacterium]
MKAARPSLDAFLRFLRWPNLLLITLFLLVFDQAVVGAISASIGMPPALDGIPRVLLILDVLIVTLIGYWLNDLQDVATDSINRPDRFLVRYPAYASKAKAWVVWLVAIGLCLTAAIGYWEGRLEWMGLYPAAVLGLFFYARHGKFWGLWGNSFVSFMIAALPMLWILAEIELFQGLKDASPVHFESVTKLLLCYAALMFFSNLARELSKDVEDMRGDQAVNGRSFPLRIGVAGTSLLMTAFLLMIAGVQTLMVALLPRSLLLSVFSAVVFFLLLMFVRWIQKLGFSEAAPRLNKGLKWLMLIGLMQLFSLPTTLF